MDYIFFAFSSLSVALTVIFAFLLLAGRDQQPRALLILVACLAGGVFFYLENTYAGRSPVFYYLANSLPQIMLIILFGLCLKKCSKN